MSTHRVLVTKVERVTPHPNADRLDIVQVYGGYTCVTERGLWSQGDLAAFVEPDYVVPETPEWEWMGPDKRVGAKRLRGIWSQGVLVPPPPGAREGDNVMEVLGVTRWVPPVKEDTGTDDHPNPPVDLLYLHTYDIENFRAFSEVWTPGEEVWCSEKLHGAQARFVWHENQLWVGSKGSWKVRAPGSPWWRAVDNTPWVVEWVKAHHSTVLYGEVFGSVQDLKYGATKGEVWVRVFDVQEPKGGRFWSLGELQQEFPNGELVPVLYQGPLNLETLETLVLGDSQVCPGQMMEGVVIHPTTERTDPRIGRVISKLVSPRYLEKKGKRGK